MIAYDKPALIDSGRCCEDCDATESLLLENDIRAASGETSQQYEGIVLAKAIEIVRHRLRFPTWNVMADRLGITRRTLTFARRGAPIRATTTRDWYLRLEELLRCRAPSTHRA